MEIFLEVAVGLFAALGVVSAALIAYIVASAFYYQEYLARGLRRDLGFRERTAGQPAVNGRGYVTCVSIHSVEDSGVLARAGFRPGDVLPDESNQSLFERLHRHRGRELELAVVEGGPGPNFRWRPRRVIRFDVPLRGRLAPRDPYLQADFGASESQ